MQCHEKLIDYIPTCPGGITWLLANKTKIYLCFTNIANISTDIKTPINTQAGNASGENECEWHLLSYLSF